jgi:hypothetical protein
VVDICRQFPPISPNACAAAPATWVYKFWMGSLAS